MQPRRKHETTVSMVPTPRPPATAPRVPASRAQSLRLGSLGSPRLPHPLQLKLDDARRPLLHTHTCMFTHRVTPWYMLFVICTHTHTHIHRERGESSKLRCGFVPSMNLQRDSTESPFTYMYVINTTYYYYLDTEPTNWVLKLLMCSVRLRGALVHDNMRTVSKRSMFFLGLHNRKYTQYRCNWIHHTSNVEKSSIPVPLS